MYWAPSRAWKNWETSTTLEYLYRITKRDWNKVEKKSLIYHLRIQIQVAILLGDFLSLASEESSFCTLLFTDSNLLKNTYISTKVSCISRITKSRRKLACRVSTCTNGQMVAYLTGMAISWWEHTLTLVSNWLRRARSWWTASAYS